MGKFERRPMSISPEEDLLADGLMTVREAARFAGLGRTKLYELMAEGRIAYLKVGGARRIPRRAMVEFLKTCLVGGRTTNGHTNLRNSIRPNVPERVSS